MVENVAGLSEERLAALAADVGGHRTLQDVVNWGIGQSPPRIVVDVVVQDEFTHDVVVPIGDELHLVYDTT